MNTLRADSADTPGPLDWDRLNVSPGENNTITTNGIAGTGRPCVIDLTEVTALSEQACELLCASVWRCSRVEVVGGSVAARAAVAAHVSDCGAVLADELIGGCGR